jgi:hypothetical protein
MPWGTVAYSLVIPHITFEAGYLTAVVAIAALLGTGQLKVIPQQVQQRCAAVRFHLIRMIVDGEIHGSPCVTRRRRTRGLVVSSLTTPLQPIAPPGT